MVSRIVTLLSREITSVNQAALLLGGFTFLSQIFGLIRDRLLASRLGPGPELDAYYAAFKIPDFLFISATALVSIMILIPLFESYRKEGKDTEENKQFINEIITIFSLGMTWLSLIAFFLMPYVSRLIAPGFQAWQIVEVTQLGRIMLVSPFLLGLSNIFATITQTHRKFLVFALSPVLYNIGIILGILFFYTWWGISGLGFGVVLGALLHMAIQLPVIIRDGYRLRPTFRIQWWRIKMIIVQSVPRTLALSLNRITPIILTAIASTALTGSVSLLTLALNIQNVPLALVGVSYSVAAFPVIARHFAEGNREKFIESIIGPARQIIFWSLPIVALFVVVRAQIVRVILGAGYFDWADTRLTAAMLALFVISVTAQSLMLLYARGFYAAEQTRIPLVVNTVSAVITVIVALFSTRLYLTNPELQIFVESLMRIEGIPGSQIVMLAFAYSVGTIINSFILWYLFRRKFMVGISSGMQRTLLESLMSTFILGGVAYAMLQLFDPIFSDETFFGVLGHGFVSGMIGILCAVFFLIAIKNEEMMAVRRALFQKKISPSEIRSDETSF